MSAKVIVSDQHHHNWNVFATTDEHGVNSRLQIQLDELKRAALEAKALNVPLYDTGDVFHVRGSLAPSVLNPVVDTYNYIVNELGVKVVVLTGNHDLESKTSNRLSSAITALSGVGVISISKPTILDGNYIVPWVQSIKELKTILEEVPEKVRKTLDLLIHAPVDGVIDGIPNHGLDVPYLQSLGYKRVFAGHYHHHKQLAENIWSVGATTQQNWGSIGTKAGYIVASDTEVSWRASRAPEFVEIDSDTDEAEIPLIVDGNYVRAKVNTNKQSEITTFRKILEKMNAKGVTILPQKTVAVSIERSKTAISAGATVEGSITSYVASAGYSNHEKVALKALEILAEVRGSK